MLSKLCIKNYILIEDLTLELDKGLNIISGETGAGKSIIISAISFLLGAKTDKNIVMPNKDYARVEIEFINLDTKTLQVLEQLGVEVLDNLILSRKLTQDGKNDIRANGQIITLSMLRQISERLIEIYGQHAYQVLLDENKHIDFIDAILKDKLNPKTTQLYALLQQKNDITKQLAELNSDDTAREREKQMLEYQINEITDANLNADEEEQLNEKLSKMKNTQKVVENLNIVANILDSNDAECVLTMLYNALHYINSISGVDANIESLSGRLDSAKIELEDIKNTCQDIMQSYDFSEEDFYKTDARIDEIKALKRKYGQSIEEVLSFCQSAQDRLNTLNNSEEIIAKLKEELLLVESQIQKVCAEITNIRKQAGNNLTQQLLDELTTLGLKDARFSIDIQPTTITTKGADKVSFWFSANPGQKLMPLNKVMSGGEMSRFMLAFDIIFGLDQFGTLIFDEIDTGISGEVSYKVAFKMYELSKHNQIIAITHLPAICAMADANFKVVKNVIDGQTFTSVEKLDNINNIDEIARLTGAITKSAIALQNAQELKALCNQKKVSISN